MVVMAAGWPGADGVQDPVGGVRGTEPGHRHAVLQLGVETSGILGLKKHTKYDHKRPENQKKTTLRALQHSNANAS